MQHRVYNLRITVVFCLFLLAFGRLAVFLYDLQIRRHQELYGKARDTYTARRRRIGRRGAIRDRHGNLLVGDLNCKDVLAEPRRIPPERRETMIELLCQVLDVDRTVLQRRFRSPAVEVVVKKAVDANVAAYLKRLKLPGLRFADDDLRYYPKSQLLANVLGFTDGNGHGAYGLEKRWDEALQPREAEVTYERDRKGRILTYDPLKELRPEDGRTLYLTIDEPIQDIVERELHNLVSEFKPQRAYAVMANPANGELLAMAQWPSFDPNCRQKMVPELWRNHIIADVYDPGSTMKCVAIAGALDYGVVSLDTVIDCEKGHWVYARRSLRDSGHRYGRLSVAEIIQKSSNIGTAKIALMVGKPRLYQVFRRFGFGSRTGVGLDHESPGILRSPAAWDGLSITRFPIGQGISVTAAQMIQAYSALANHGKLTQLHLVHRVEDPTTGQCARVEPVELHAAVSEAAAEKVVQAMIRVTQEGGTATKAAVPGYETAGKTGTSQKCIDGSYVGHHKYIASFIGFVPARAPAFVLLVVADEPSNGFYYGGTVCAPTFKRIAEQTLRYLNVGPVRRGPEQLAATHD